MLLPPFLKKLRVIFLFFPLLTFSNSTLSQNFQLLIDPINSTGSSSIINLSLINNSSYSGKVELTASLRTRRGSELLRQETVIEVSPNGMNSVRGNAINPTTSFIDSEFDQIYNLGSNLPPLNYVLCIKARAISDAKMKSQECVDYSATDFVNILPLYPTEFGEVYEQRPIFTWMDLNNKGGYSYNFKLVKLEKGQNSNAALRRNNPLIIKENVKENQLLFPSDAKALKNNNSYAWQVSLNYQGEELVTSEPWTFTYKEEDSLLDIPRNLSYVDIGEVENGVSLLAVGDFKFKVKSERLGVLEAELYELKNGVRKIKKLSENQFQMKIGVNKYELDLKEQVYLKHLRDYHLVLMDNESLISYSFKITYINPDYIK